MLGAIPSATPTPIDDKDAYATGERRMLLVLHIAYNKWTIPLISGRTICRNGHQPQVDATIEVRLHLFLESMNYAARRPIFVIPFNQYGPAEIIANRFDGLTTRVPRPNSLCLTRSPSFNGHSGLAIFDSYVSLRAEAFGYDQAW